LVFCNPPADDFLDVRRQALTVLLKENAAQLALARQALLQVSTLESMNLASWITTLPADTRTAPSVQMTAVVAVVPGGAVVVPVVQYFPRLPHIIGHRSYRATVVTPALLLSCMLVSQLTRSCWPSFWRVPSQPP